MFDKRWSRLNKIRIPINCKSLCYQLRPFVSISQLIENSLLGPSNLFEREHAKLKKGNITHYERNEALRMLRSNGMVDRRPVHRMDRCKSRDEKKMHWVSLNCVSVSVLWR